MPQFSKPFWRADRKRWMLQLHPGQVITLGADRDAAFRKYYAMMAESDAVHSPTPAVASGEEPLVVEILDQFLEWVQKNRKPRTYLTYKVRLQFFLTALEDRSLTVSKFKPFHVTRFTDKHPNWSPTMRRGCMQAVQTAFNWGVREGFIDHSPIAKLQKPSPGRRDNPVTETDHQAILAATPSRAFQELLTLAWETGARPQELIRVEARHFDRNLSALVLPPEEAKGNQWRAVYLSPAARTLVESLCQRQSEGALLRNERGKPWHVWAINCAFTRVQKKIGRRFCLYDYRHGWATAALENGIDPVTVSVLMGHRDSSMLCRVYQHLARNTANLRATASRVRVKPSSASTAPVADENAEIQVELLRSDSDGTLPRRRAG